MDKKQAKTLLDDINFKLEEEQINLDWFIGTLDQHGLLE